MACHGIFFAGSMLLLIAVVQGFQTLYLVGRQASHAAAVFVFHRLPLEVERQNKIRG